MKHTKQLPLTPIEFIVLLYRQKSDLLTSTLARTVLFVLGATTGECTSSFLCLEQSLPTVLIVNQLSNLSCLNPVLRRSIAPPPSHIASLTHHQTVQTTRIQNNSHQHQISPGQEPETSQKCLTIHHTIHRPQRHTCVDVATTPQDTGKRHRICTKHS